MRKSKLLIAYGNTGYTENGAVTNKSTGSSLLDFYLHAPARRDQDNTQLFLDSLREDELLTLKALFYLRDVRGGKGERDTFRKLLLVLWNKNTDLFNAVIPFVAEYGRWDDLLEFWANENVVQFIRKRLFFDYESDTPSLLAKWMPSENTSSKETVALAKHWIDALEVTPPYYRRMLSAIRRKLNVVETKMSAKEWDGIEYSHVPSKANVNYRKAFSRHDPEGYVKFIEKAKQGKVKINSGTLYPHEIIGRVRLGEYDDTLEALWRQLPDYTGGKNALVVVDVSGSMTFSEAKIPNSRYYAVDVSMALGIYFADKNKGAFANHIITFNDNPKLVELKGKTLRDKLYGLRDGAGTSTNIQGVFDELLKVAKRNNVPQEEMPEVIFIVSDMQFNRAEGNQETNFEVIKEKYAKSGYVMPKLVFWNVASRVTESPVTKDENGVYLASGFSTDTFAKVLQLDETVVPVQTPEELMLHVLNGDRYAPIDEVYETSYLKLI